MPGLIRLFGCTSVLATLLCYMVGRWTSDAFDRHVRFGVRDAGDSIWLCEEFLLVAVVFDTDSV